MVPVPLFSTISATIFCDNTNSLTILTPGTTKLHIKHLSQLALAATCKNMDKHFSKWHEELYQVHDDIYNLETLIALKKDREQKLKKKLGITIWNDMADCIKRNFQKLGANTCNVKNYCVNWLRYFGAMGTCDAENSANPDSENEPCFSQTYMGKYHDKPDKYILDSDSDDDFVLKKRHVFLKSYNEDEILESKA